MNPDLVYDLLDLATTLAARQVGGSDLDQILIQIVKKAFEAYEDHADQPMDLAAIQAEAEV